MIWEFGRSDYTSFKYQCWVGGGSGIYPSRDNTFTIGTNEQKFSSVYSYAYNGASDFKLKKNINPINSSWADEFIDGLIPSTYQFKNNSYGKLHTGFIAQDVEQLMLKLGMKRTDFAGLIKTPKNTPVGVLDENEDFEGADENYDYSLRYDDFIAPLVTYCQNLKKKNIELEHKLNKIYEKLGLSD